MAETTGISWTDHTFNPWWGCSRVSAACDFCYAEAFAHRLGLDIWGKDSGRRMFGDKHWNEPLRWDKAAAKAGVRRRVFCASMADVFEDHAALPEARERLWLLIAATPNLDWLLLTKRPENIAKMVPAGWVVDGAPHNVWLGTTVEDQRYANIRIPKLLAVRATVHFLSMEPLLGATDVARWLGPDGVNWLILGGESGAKARPFDLEWSRSLIAQARNAGPHVAVWMKQLGQLWAKQNGYGPTHAAEPEAWPDDLRIQEAPTGRYTREVATLL